MKDLQNRQEFCYSGESGGGNDELAVRRRPVRRMSWLLTNFAKIVVAVALLAAAASVATAAGKRTVCTITVNSADEKETLRRHLPKDEYQFVELVERGRPDWLASACRQQVRCDALIVSGHFNGTEFFSDQLEVSEFLPVQEMERASCAPSCAGLFSQLKEVYLFGCNTLNTETTRTLATEIERSLVRAGSSRVDAERVSYALMRRYGQSNRDVTRRVFTNVPIIYGFSSRAPVGPTAASLLNRYFQSSSVDRLGNGGVNRKLLASFSSSSMTVVGGMSATDPQAAYREEACRFVDERLSPAQKLDFIHQVLRRGTAESRMFLDRIEGFLSSLDEAQRQEQAVAEALGAIARDGAARDRYLTYARDVDQAPIRARMTAVARDLGWLSPADYRIEIVRMIEDLLARPTMTAAEVDLVCALNDDRSLDPALGRLDASLVAGNRVDRAAALACLGSPEHHGRMLLALTSPSPDEVRMAEVYFHRRPITDPDELRVVAASIAHMNSADAQARALEVLAQHRLSDTESLAEVTRLFPVAGSVNVQRAIAGLIIRSDYRMLAKPETLRMLRETRLRAPGGEDIIDILIRRLEASS